MQFFDENFYFEERIRPGPWISQNFGNPARLQPTGWAGPKIWGPRWDTDWEHRLVGGTRTSTLRGELTGDIEG